ncbi:ABC transporter permease [Sporichthya brevicatena]|uniref:ABC transporter permease n=1 Tax=Sporichthya brevicatena TaxID=171442 RepID=A0ABN1H9S6_9ACTN
MSALFGHRGARVGLVLAGLLALLALLGPFLTSDPDAPDYRNQLAGPSWEHWLGTDRAGRDLLARTVAGAQTSLGAALLVTVIATAIGLVVGILAATGGRAVDAVLTRVTDVLLGLPGTVLTLAIVGVLGPGFLNLVLAMSVTGWAGLAKLARAYAGGARARPDVLAARMAGATPTRIALGHVLPGTAALVAVAATLRIGHTVMELAALSFLGLGAQPPTAEWGNMLAESRETLAAAQWQVLGPGVGLVLTVLAATLIADALRDAVDPGNRT